MADKVRVSGKMIDITAPEIVQIQIRADKKVIWVNVNGICRLRCCMIEHLEVDDLGKSSSPGDSLEVGDQECPE